MLLKYFVVYFSCTLISSAENAALGRTARERWKLFKNVAKLGLQRTPSITNAGAGNSTAAHNSHCEVDAETEMKTTISMENILAADDDEDAYNQMMPVVSVFSRNSYCQFLEDVRNVLNTFSI